MFKISAAITTGLVTNGLQQNEFAVLMKLTEPYVSWLCTGKAQTSMQTAERMATVLGVSFSEFIKWGES